MNEQLDLFLPFEEAFKMSTRAFMYGVLTGAVVTFITCLLVGLYL